jgi:general secretion pathway protein E
VSQSVAKLMAPPAGWTVAQTGDAPKVVAAVLEQAIASGASDLYLLPESQGVRVRTKVAGQQLDHGWWPRPLGDHCLTHLKALGGLLTYRTQVAQDGVIRRPGAKGPVELRLAAMPTVHGERLALRLRGTGETPLRLAELGLEPAVVAALHLALRRGAGLVILTGPTGCGKTTTIYALVRELLAMGEDPASIITVEDPVESLLPGISQSSVSGQHEDWGYPQALRAALRQDVKTLVIGELRDREVVRVALDAALSGHRIITTFHAGDLAGVFGRLLHLGFEPFLVAATVNLVLTQRLWRGPEGALVPSAAVVAPDDELRELLCRKPSLGELRAHLSANPQADLRAQAEALVRAGQLAPSILEVL